MGIIRGIVDFFSDIISWSLFLVWMIMVVSAMLVWGYLNPKYFHSDVTALHILIVGFILPALIPLFLRLFIVAIPVIIAIALFGIFVLGIVMIF